MKIFNPVAIGKLESQPSLGGGKEEVVAHTHQNLAVLNGLSINEHGVLQFEGKPVDTVGQEFVNAAILEQFSVVDNKLYFAGAPVDTVGSVFSNDAVLRMFSQSEEGTLLFNGLPIEGGSGTSLPNAEDLKRLAIDENGQLTVDGVVVSGSGGAVTLSVVKLGSGTALLKGVVGTDLQTRSLVAGSNVTLDVSGDEIKINASLSGAVSSATTFKASDGYANSSTISNNAETRIAGAEAPTSEPGLLFLARLGSDVKSSITDVALPVTGSVTPNTALSSSLNGIATAFNNGRLTVPNGTTYTATSPASWFAGTVDWTIEVDLWRSSSNMGTMQNIVSGWNGSIAASSVWVIFNSSNTITVRMANGASTYVDVVSSIAIADTNKHHVEINRSGGVVRIFIDGALAGSASVSVSINAGTGGFGVGGTLVGVDPFYGFLRNVKVYNYAKHTAAYTVPGYYADKVGAVNTVSMAGKLLSASFWKQISSLSVVSTETETSYLKWLLLDSNGLWSWDAANKVWVSSTLANILTSGMTTAALKTALTNNNWNYRSDTIGFAVAFVTDGTTSPVLTSLTLNAIQSADKTAGHTVLNGSASAMPQRTQLQFEGMTVTDNGVSTVVKGATLSSDLMHSGESLEFVVNALQQNSGHIGSKSVDLRGLQHGSTLAFDAVSNGFKAASPAQGASGNGLFATDPFTLAPGEEKTVTHQLVLGGRAVYQADSILSGEDLEAKFPLSRISEIVSTSLFKASVSGQTTLSLQRTTSTPVKSTGAAFPVAHGFGIAYRVGEYIYLIPVYAGAVNTVSLSVYRAHVSAPTSWTLLPDTLPKSFVSIGVVQCVLTQYEGYTYMVLADGIYRASFENPAYWTLYAPAAPISGSPVHILNGYMYLFGSSSDAKIYRASMADLTQWSVVGTMPDAVTGPSFWTYGDYMYRAGGNLAAANTSSNKVWRASVSDPTSWTQIGTLPATTGYATLCVVGSKVMLFGGRTDATTLFRNTAYISDAGNPVTWSSMTALTSATILSVGYVVGNSAYVVGGYKTGPAYVTDTNVYTLKQTASASSGVVVFQDQNVSLFSKLKSASVSALLGSGYALKYAVSLDGVWHAYDGSSLKSSASMDGALASSTPATLSSGIQYSLAGLADLDISSVVSLKLAVALETSDLTSYGEILGAGLTFVTAQTASPLQIAGYTSSAGDIGLMHILGDYSSTNVKNKTSSEMTVVLKVYDGAL